MRRVSERGKSYNGFLFMFFPFAFGLILSRYVWAGIAREAPVLFPVCLILLLLSAASVYGGFSSLVLFFSFGCCAATFFDGYSVTDLTGEDGLLTLSPYFFWFPALFCAGQLGLNNTKQLCFDGHGVPRLKRTLKTTLTQVLILVSAAALSLYFIHR